MKNIQEKKMIKVWIIKYALTQGIFERSAEICFYGDSSGNMVVVPGRFDQYYHGKGKEWCEDYESAKQRAEQMKINKIKNLKKQIEKLEKLKF
jgi:hypothetical protein